MSSGEKPRLRHHFSICMWDDEGHEDLQNPPSFLGERLTREQIYRGLCNLAETARLMMPRRSPGLQAVYVYAYQEDGVATVFDQGMPEFDAYLREEMGARVVRPQRHQYQRT